MRLRKTALTSQCEVSSHPDSGTTEETKPVPMLASGTQLQTWTEPPSSQQSYTAQDQARKTPQKNTTYCQPTKTPHLHTTLALEPAAFPAAPAPAGDGPCAAPAAPLLPMVILLALPSAAAPPSLFGLVPSSLTLPLRFILLACPAVKARRVSRPALDTDSEGGEHVIGGDPRRWWRLMPLVAEAGPE